MINKQRVKEIAEGGKVLTSEARKLASMYINCTKILDELSADVERLSGGKIVSRLIYDYEKILTRVRQHISIHNTITASVDSLLDEINKKLLSVSRVERSRQVAERYEIKGAEKNIDDFLELNKLITQAIQRAYDAGAKDGSNLLMGLADGSLSVNEFNEKSR